MVGCVVVRLNEDNGVKLVKMLVRFSFVYPLGHRLVATVAAAEAVAGVAGKS